MPIRVKVPGGDSFLTDDLTLDEVIAVEQQIGEGWQFLNPLRSAAHCKAILTAFVARTKGREAAEVEVGSMSLTEALDCIEVVDDDDLPDQFVDGMPDPKAPETQTGSSSGRGDS